MTDDVLFQVLRRPDAIEDSRRSRGGRPAVPPAPTDAPPLLPPNAQQVGAVALEESAVALDEALPSPAVTLLVRPEGDRTYSVEILAPEHLAPPPPATRRPMPNLSIADVRRQRIRPSDVDFLLSEFAAGRSDLRKWLNQACARLGEEIVVIIHDYTDGEIPWELFQLSTDGPRRYLGTAATVTRWLSTTDYNDDDLLWHNSPREIAGGILAYVNLERTSDEKDSPYELAHAPEEKQWLKQSGFCRDTALKHDIRDWMKTLQGPVPAQALVYLACHGDFSPANILELYLGSNWKRDQQIRLRDLDKLPLTLLRSARSIVFINACHSGRLNSTDERLRDGRQRGFVEVFLRKGAGGVIATFAGVRDELASGTARALIEKIQQQPDVPVAKLLRQMRQEAVAAVLAESEAEIERMLHVFMYVYYGHSETVVRLVPA